MPATHPSIGHSMTGTMVRMTSENECITTCGRRDGVTDPSNVHRNVNTAEMLGESGGSCSYRAALSEVGVGQEMTQHPWLLRLPWRSAPLLPATSRRTQEAPKGHWVRDMSRKEHRQQNGYRKLERNAIALDGVREHLHRSTVNVAKYIVGNCVRYDRVSTTAEAPSSTRTTSLTV